MTDQTAAQQPQPYQPAQPQPAQPLPPSPQPAWAVASPDEQAGQPFPGGRGPVPMTPADETTWSTVGHLSWLAGSLVALPFLAPLVLWLVLRERGPFVRHHLGEAVNFQLSLLVYGLAVGVLGGVVTLLTVGLFAPVWAALGAALVIFGVVLTVLAAVAASRGQWYRYPLTIRFLR